MNRRCMVFLFVVSLCLPVAEGFAMEKAEIYGVVDKIISGGTIRVKLADSSRLPKEYFGCSKVYKTMAWVYLLGVKAPDFRGKEYCSTEAYNFGKQKAFGKEVRLEVDGCGPYGGLRAFVWQSEFGKKEFSLNYELVKAGLASLSDDMSVFKNNATYNKYRVAENKASEQNIGLWGESSCKSR